MKIKAKINDWNEWLFDEELVDLVPAEVSFEEKHINIQKQAIQLDSYQILSKGIFLIQAEMYFRDAIQITAEIEGEAIISQFIVTKNPSNKAVFSKHNIRYIPSLVEVHDVPSQQRCCYFLLIMTPTFYTSLITVKNEIHDLFKRRMLQKNSVSIVEEDLRATPEMLKTLEDLSKTKDKKELKQIYTNAKILELIILQFEQFGLSGQKQHEELKTEDIYKLEHAQKILEKQYITPPTHKELSKLVLLNEFKLRQGFKLYYGTTIYNFITRIRMEEAKRLILDDQKNMYEVGTLIGFKHQASFTHAFKKYYGLLPSELIK